MQDEVKPGGLQAEVQIVWFKVKMSEGQKVTSDSDFGHFLVEEQKSPTHNNTAAKIIIYIISNILWRTISFVIWMMI